MRKINRKLGMKWYNFLVCLWLPLNVIIAAISALFCVAVLIDLVSGSDSININLIISGVYLILVSLITFVFTIEVKRTLRTFETKGPKLLTIWYLLPILFNIVALFVTYPLWPTVASNVAESFPALTAEMVSQYVLWVFLGLILAMVARAFLMILLNMSYFLKREELFDDMVYVAGQDIASQFDF